MPISTQKFLLIYREDGTKDCRLVNNLDYKLALSLVLVSLREFEGSKITLARVELPKGSEGVIDALERFGDSDIKFPEEDTIGVFELTESGPVAMIGANFIHIRRYAKRIGFQVQEKS